MLCPICLYIHSRYIDIQWNHCYSRLAIIYSNERCRLIAAAYRGIVLRVFLRDCIVIEVWFFNGLCACTMCVICLRLLLLLFCVSCRWTCSVRHWVAGVYNKNDSPLHSLHYDIYIYIYLFVYVVLAICWVFCVSRRSLSLCEKRGCVAVVKVVGCCLISPLYKGMNNEINVVKELRSPRQGNVWATMALPNNQKV